MPFVSDEELFSAPAASKPAGNFVSDDELFAAPAEDTSTFGQVKKAVVGTGKNLGAVADMVLSLPGQAVQVGGEIGMRINAAAHGIDQRTAGIMAKKFGQDIGEPLMNPVAKVMAYFGHEEGYDDSQVSAAMGKVSSWIEKGGDYVEKKTGGALTMEDVQALVNTGMVAAGGRGLGAAQGRLDAMGRVPLSREVPEQAPAAEPAGPRAPRPEPANGFAEYQAKKATETDLGRSDARTNAEQQAYDLMQKGASKAQVEAIVKRNPLVGEAMAAIRSRRAMASESGLGRVLQGEVLDPETGLTPDFGSPDTPRLGAGREVVPTAGEPLTAAANKNPLWLGAAGLAGTGLALSLAYPEHRDSVLEAGGLAGALIIGKNRGLSLADIRALPDSAPLGHVLNNSAYTLKTLERLPRNKTTFSVQEVLDQAKRADVSDTEKTLFRDAIDMAGGDGKTISAKELVANIKELAEHQELTKEDFHGENYSEYGIGALDREAKSVRDGADRWEPDAATQEAAAQGAWAPAQGWGKIEAAPRPPVVEDITTLWKNPKIKFDGSHFSDSDVFGHTRSFIQDGVRHVIEVQSDFVQKGMKKVDEKALQEAREALPTNLKQLEIFKGLPPIDSPNWNAGVAERLVRWREINPDAELVIGEELRRRMGSTIDGEQLLEEKLNEGRPVNGELHGDQIYARSLVEDALQNYMGDIKRLISQQRNTIDQATQNIRYRGMAKDFAKRLVREELAREAAPKLNPEYVALREKAKNEVRGIKMHESWIKELLENADNPADPPPYVRRQVADYRAVIKQAETRANGFLEEALKAGRNLPAADVARFATADTVAKVEGWPTDLRGARERANDAVIRAEDHIGDLRLTLRNASSTATAKADAQSLLPAAEKELLAAREKLAELSKPDARVPFLDPGHQSLYDRHKKEVEGFTLKLGGKLVTDASGHTWVEVPTKPFSGPTQMYGRVDADFQRFLATAAGGALLGTVLADSDSKFIGAVFGAAALPLAARAIKLASSKSEMIKGIASDFGKDAQKTVTSLDVLLGAVSTRIGNISEPLLRRSRNYERNVLERTHNYIAQTAAFSTELKKVSGDLGKRLAEAILTNDPKRINDLIEQAKSPRLAQEWRRTREMLDTLGHELQSFGRLGGMRGDYFPRVVKDLEGLLGHFGKEVKSDLEAALIEAEKRATSRRGFGLDDVEKSRVINSYLQGREALGAKPGFAKNRSILEVTPELAKYYATPIEGLHTYINSAVRDIEKSKFFGRDLKRVGEGESRFIDTDASIGEMLQRERSEGRITAAQEGELAAIFKARFGAGERAPNSILSAVKNVAYMGLLGNAVSAASQLGDVATSVYLHGLRPTTAAVVRRLTRRGTVDMRNYGLEDHIAEEFVNVTRTAKILNATFKMAGFTMVDAFGKNVALEAGRIKYQKLLKTQTGKATFTRKYAKMFEGDLPQVIADLEAGKLTDLAREVHFTELSDMQPITKLEMPQKYLEAPNGRFMYMLKTFMLKQADIVRRDGYNEIKKGNVRAGVSNLLRYGVALGVGGATADMVKDWMLGREVNFDSKSVMENVYKTFLWSRYVADKAEKDGFVKSFVENNLLPPYKAVNVLGEYFKTHDTEKQEDKALRDAVRLIPVGGKLYEAHMMGGAEKRQAIEQKVEKARLTSAEKRAARLEAGHALSDDELAALRKEARARKQLQGARP